MKNFQGYRDDLAKNLKEIRKTDPQKAEAVLNDEKNTEKYKIAQEDRRDDEEQKRLINNDEMYFASLDQERGGNWTKEEIAHYEAEVYGKIKFSDVEEKMKNYSKDVERISNVLGEKDLEKCTALWIQHSNSVSAGWLHLPEDDEEEKGDVTLLNILKDTEKCFSPSDIIRDTSKEK